MSEYQFSSSWSGQFEYIPDEIDTKSPKVQLGQLPQRHRCPSTRPPEEPSYFPSYAWLIWLCRLQKFGKGWEWFVYVCFIEFWTCFREFFSHIFTSFLTMKSMNESHLAAPLFRCNCATLSQKPVVQVNLLDYISKRGPSRKPDENFHSKHLSHWREMQPTYAKNVEISAAPTPFNNFLRKLGSCRLYLGHGPTTTWLIFGCSLPETFDIKNRKQR